MPYIHIHVLSKTHLISSVLCDENTIEHLPPRLSLFIALHSVCGYYKIPTVPDYSSSTQFFSGSPIPYHDKFNLLRTNKEKINYACSILNRPNIF